jgi:hypothetical protein
MSFKGTICMSDFKTLPSLAPADASKFLAKAAAQKKPFAKPQARKGNGFSISRMLMIGIPVAAVAMTMLAVMNGMAPDFGNETAEIAGNATTQIEATLDAAQAATGIDITADASPVLEASEAAQSRFIEPETVVNAAEVKDAAEISSDAPLGESSMEGIQDVAEENAEPPPPVEEVKEAKSARDVIADLPPEQQSQVNTQIADINRRIYAETGVVTDVRDGPIEMIRDAIWYETGVDIGKVGGSATGMTSGITADTGSGDTTNQVVRTISRNLFKPG